MEPPAQLGPRLVRKVAVGYELKAFPPALIRSFLVLRRKLERAGYEIDVAMRPLSDLPPDVDVVFVATALLPAAQQALPGIDLRPMVLTMAYQPAFDELLQELNAGQRLCARRADMESERPSETRRIILRYRGHDQVF